jgi:penicillin-binding protein 2
MQELHARLSDRQSLEFKRRFMIFFVAISLALLFIMMRLVYLQIVKGDELRQKSENNSVRLRKIRPPPGIDYGCQPPGAGRESAFF